MKLITWLRLFIAEKKKKGFSFSFFKKKWIILIFPFILGCQPAVTKFYVENKLQAKIIGSHNAMQEFTHKGEIYKVDNRATSMLRTLIEGAAINQINKGG